MAKSLAFGITINGVGLGEKELAKIEKGAKKAKTEVDALTKAWKANENEIENMSRKQSQLAAAERRFNKATKDELKAENEQRKTSSAIRKKQVQDAIEMEAKEKRSIEGLRLIVRDLRKEYNQLSDAQLNSAGGRARLKQLQQEEQILQRRERSYGLASRNVGNYPLGQVGGQVASNLTGGLIGGGSAAAALAVTAAIAAATREIIDLNVKIDKQQGAVAKTTGLTAQGIENVTDALKDLDTTTSTLDLLKIAEEVGRFGVNTEEGVIKATKALNLLAQGLGDEFSGGVSEITTVVAQLSNVVYGATNDGELMAKRYLNLGNVLNGLANAGSATAGQIADVATRIGGTSKALGFTEDQILGISSAIVEAGINVERGSGAFTRVQGQIRQNSAEIAKFLGVTKELFEETLDTKPLEAFNMLISKVQETSGGKGSKMIQILKDLKINGEGSRELFLKWGQQQELFNERIGQSGQLIGDINTLLKDQETLTDNVSGQWSRLANAIADDFESSRLQKALKNGLRDAADLVEMSKILDDDRLSYSDKLKIGAIDGIEAKRAYAGRVTGDTGRANAQGRGRRDIAALNRQKEAFKEQNDQLEDYKTKEQIKAEEKRLKAIEKAKEKEAKRLQDLKDKGSFNSVTNITGRISELESDILKTDPNDTKKIQSLLNQIKALNKELERAKMLVDDNKLLNRAGDRSLLDLIPADSISGRSASIVGGTSDSDRIGAAVGLLGKSFEQQKEDEKKLEEQQEQARDIYFSAAQQTVDGLFEIWNNYEDRKTENALNKIDAEYDARLAAVKGNATLEEALLREMEEKKDEIEKKAAKKRQQRAIIQANIDIAAAVISAATTQPFIPVGLAATIAAAALGAVQLGVIKSQKFASGGFTPNVNGIPDETGHVPVGTVHDGEWVANKKFVSNNRPLFRYLENIQSNTYRPFASGGFASSDIRVPQIFNSLEEATRSGGRMLSSQDLAELKMVIREGAFEGTYYGGDDKERKAEQRNIAITNSVR